MARVQIEEILDHLGGDIRRALGAAVEEVLPGANCDQYALFRAFKRAVGRKCNQWEQVPDSLVDAG
jgi:hypothetical protein